MADPVPIRPDLFDRLRRDGGPPDNGDMEARIAKLEAGVAHLERDVSDMRVELRQLRADQRTDFRLTWGALMTAALGLAGLMAKGFGWL